MNKLLLFLLLLAALSCNQKSDILLNQIGSWNVVDTQEKTVNDSIVFKNSIEYEVELYGDNTGKQILLDGSEIELMWCLHDVDSRILVSKYYGIGPEALSNSDNYYIQLNEYNDQVWITETNYYNSSEGGLIALTHKLNLSRHN